MRISTVPFIFCGSFFLALLLYYPTAEAKFTFDFLDFIGSYQKNGWNIYYPLTHHVSPYVVSKIIVTSLYLLLGFSGIKWHLLSCFLVAINITPLFWLIKKLLQKNNPEIAEAASVFSAIIFLLLPYHTETIVWVGAFNYLLVGTFVLSGLYFTIRFSETISISSIFISATSFLLAAFTHEWGLFGIVAAALLLLFLLPVQKRFSASTILFFLACAAVVGVYLFNQWLSGEWISHYGAEVHLQFQWREMTTLFYKYILKIVFLSGFWSGSFRDKVYEWLALSLPNTILFGSLLVSFGFCIYRILIQQTKTSIVCLLFLLYAIFVFPVLNLYFPYWTKIIGDRYCYLTEAFLSSAFVTFLFIYGRPLRWILVPYIAILTYTLFQDICSWHSAGQISSSLEKNFEGYGSRRVFFLNMPDNFQGAYMLRSGFGSGMSGRCVKHLTNALCTEQMTDVASYNMGTLMDSAIVEVKDSTTLHVRLSNPGSWLWYYGVGAHDYENDLLKFTLDGKTNAYSVVFKDKNNGDVFLYQSGSHWKRVEKF